MNIEIKPVTNEEHSAIHKVYHECADFISLGPDSRVSVDMAVADIEEAKAESGIFCGIYYGKTMIGVVSFVPSRFEFRPVDAFILLLMIIPSYRRRGIGREVVKRVEEEIRARGRIRSIICGVQVNNPGAIKFWEKQDYVIFAGPEKRQDGTTVYRMRKDIERGKAKTGARP